MLGTEANKVKEIPITYDEYGPYVPKILETILCLKHDLNTILYFRGESKKHKYVIPSFYRDDNENLIRNGSEPYYRHLMSELGKDDYSEGATLTRTMAEFRHFGALTRIIDISRNPLASLFFSSERNDKDDGYIYIFATNPSYKEYFDTGHTIAIKTALNLMPQSQIDSFLFDCECLFELYANKNHRVIDFSNVERSLTPVDCNTFFRMTTEDLSKNRNLFVEKKDNKVTSDPLFSNPRYKYNSCVHSICDFMMLLNQRARVREKLIYPFRIYFDLNKAHIFIPSMNTVRINRQRGAFIFPAYVSTTDIDKDTTDCEQRPITSIQEEVQSSIFDYLYNGDGNLIRIPADIKSSVRNELYELGIDGGFLYSDIQHQSDTLLAKYK